MTRCYPFGVSTVSGELRQCVYELVGADDDLYGIDLQTTSFQPTRLTRAPEQDRAEACLAVLNTMSSMQAGDRLAVEWHDRSLDDGRTATLTITQAERIVP